jgi:hypothetical protein
MFFPRKRALPSTVPRAAWMTHDSLQWQCQTSQPYKPVQNTGSAAAYKVLKLVPRCVKTDSSQFNGSVFTHQGSSLYSL